MRALMSQPTKLIVYKLEVSQGHHGEGLKTFSKNVINDLHLFTQINCDLNQNGTNQNFV